MDAVGALQYSARSAIEEPMQLIPDTNVLFLVVSACIGVVITLVLLLYNVVALVLFLRETSDGDSSTLAKFAWATGLASLTMWCVPCLGTVLGIVSVVVSQIERVRIFRDQSSLAGATPARLGSVNGWASLIIQFLLLVSLVVGALVPTGPVDPPVESVRDLGGPAEIAPEAP